MPRSSDTRCLYCNGKIPLLQRLKNSQFCSSAHEQTYRSEQQELAIERLHQTHDSLQAYKPPEDVESILGPLSIPPAPAPVARNTIGGIANGGGDAEAQKRQKAAKPSEGESYNPDEPVDFRPSWEKLSGETMYTEEERQAPPRPQPQMSQPSPSSEPVDELSELDQFLRDTAALDKFSSKDLDLDDLAPENLTAPPKPDPSVMRHFMPKQPRQEPEPSKNDFTESLLDRLGVQDSGLSRDLGASRPPAPELEPETEPVASSPLDRLMQASEPSRPAPQPEEEEPISVLYSGPEASRMAELVRQGEPDGPYGYLPVAAPKPVPAEPASFSGQPEKVSAGVLLGGVALDAPASAFAADLPLVDHAQSLTGPESQNADAGSSRWAELEFAASSLTPARPAAANLEAARPDVLSAEYLKDLTQPVAPVVQPQAPSPVTKPVAEVAAESKRESEMDAPAALKVETPAPNPVAPQSPVVETQPRFASKPAAEIKPAAEQKPASWTVSDLDRGGEKLAEPQAKAPRPEPQKPVSGIWISEDIFGPSSSKPETRPEQPVAAKPTSDADAEPVAEPETTSVEAQVHQSATEGAEVEQTLGEPVQTAAPVSDEAAASEAGEAEEAIAEEARIAEAVGEGEEALEEIAAGVVASEEDAVQEIAADHDEAKEELEREEELEEDAVVAEAAETEPSLAGLAALLAVDPRDSEGGRSDLPGEADYAAPVSFEPEAGLPEHDLEPEAMPVPPVEEEEPDPAWASSMPLPGPSAVPALRGRSVASEVSPLETEELLIWADLEMTPAVGLQRDLWRLNESLCALEVQGATSKPGGPRAPMTAPLTGTILFPKVRLEPEPFKTVLPGSGVDRMMGPPPPRTGGGAGAGKKKRKPSGPGGMLGGVKGFWTHAPRDLKILLLVIPALLALVFHPSLPKISVSAPDTSSGVTADVKGWFDDSWTEVRAAIAARAGVALEEDFRQGLDQWISRGGATTHWSFDQTGFVKPGPLALYAPSMNLVDYQMQFLGMIDKGALSWVVRAKDFRNYYVVKLTVRQEGALPIIFVTRYAVIDGVAMDRVDTHVPIDARADTLYRVRMDLNGDDFTLAVQDQVIDTWEDPRLDRGGIGFYTGRGEDSRVRWVQLTHQYDMLGRLCAYLAPYNPSSAAGAEVAGSY